MKFSEFTNVVSPATGDKIVGYSGSDNIQMDYAALEQSVIDKLKGDDLVVTQTDDQTKIPAASLVYDMNEDLVAVQNALDTKQDELTFDTAPTSGSMNPVTSDGVYDAIEETSNEVSISNSASAEVISITDGAEYPVYDLTLNLEPHQNLNGYSHPWVGGAGKNKLPPWHTNQTHVGITYKVNDDGTFTTSGTATANSQIISDAFTLAEGSYILTGMPTTGSGSTIYLRVLLYQSDGTTLVNALANDYGSGGTFTITSEYVSNGYVLKCFTAIQSGQTAPSGTWKPMIRLSTETDATYAPYSNICPISGYDAVNVVRAGAKNIMPDNPSWVNGYYLNASNVPTAFSGYQYCQMYLPVSASTAYVISFNYTSQNIGLSVCFYDVNKTFLSRSVLHTGLPSGFNERTFTTPANTAFIRISIPSATSNIQLEKGTTATEYEANATTYPISLSSAGTVYGGTLDVTTGELVVDRAIIKPSDSEVKYHSGTSKFYFAVSDKENSVINTLYSDRFTVYTGNADTVSHASSLLTTDASCISSVNTNTSYIYIRYDGYTTVEEFNAAFANAEFVYQLATPITYHLTPTEVTTLLGNNTIWMDAEGEISIRYRANLQKYIDAKFAELQALILENS